MILNYRYRNKTGKEVVAELPEWVNHAPAIKNPAYVADTIVLQTVDVAYDDACKDDLDQAMAILGFVFDSVLP